MKRVIRQRAARGCPDLMYPFQALLDPPGGGRIESLGKQLAQGIELMGGQVIGHGVLQYRPAGMFE